MGEILDRLFVERVVSFDVLPASRLRWPGADPVVGPCVLSVSEGCDNYFRQYLTAAEFDQLIAELQQLRATMRGPRNIRRTPKLKNRR